MKKIIALAFTVLAAPAMGESYSSPTTVKGFSVGSGYVRVKLDQMESFEGCQDQDWYVLDTTTGQYGEMSLSVILAAKVSQSKLSFQLNGCQTVGAKSYPKINHVYFCEKSFCS